MIISNRIVLSHHLCALVDVTGSCALQEILDEQGAIGTYVSDTGVFNRDNKIDLAFSFLS